jgi:peptide/nickel transport system permease protein
VLTLWVAITATFFFFRLIPGDPIGSFIQNLQQNHVYNAQASEQVIEHYRHVFGLDGNIFQQYGRFLYQLIVARDLGPSLLNYPTPAQDVIARALPWTIGLLLLSTIIAWLLGTFLGALAGWRRENPLSKTATYGALAMSHIPFYFVGLLLVFLLAFRTGLFPSGYAYGADLRPGLNAGFLGSVLFHGLLPAVSIVVVGAAGNFIGMRQQLISVLGEDYLVLAEAKGLTPWRVLRRYAMPNCYLPQITGLLISFGFIFNGNVLIENLFNYPGLGYLLVQAIKQMDYNVVLGITDLSIFVVLSAVFLIDMLLPVLDPRITYAR